MTTRASSAACSPGCLSRVCCCPKRWRIRGLPTCPPGGRVRPVRGTAVLRCRPPRCWPPPRSR